MIKQLPLWRTALVLIVALGALWGCGADGRGGEAEKSVPTPIAATGSPFALGEYSLNAEGNYVLGYGTYPHMEGAVMCRPLAEALAEKHLGLSAGNVRGFVRMTGESHAFQQLVSGALPDAAYLSGKGIAMEVSPLNLLLAPEPSADDLKFALDNGTEIYSEPVAITSLVFIVHKDNPVETLTLEQVRDILAGKTTNWSAVGGQQLPIDVYWDAEGSRRQSMDVLYKEVMGDAKFAEPMREKESLAGVVEPGADEPSYYEREVVAPYRNTLKSIGFMFQTRASKMTEIKQLSLNGVRPEVGTLRDGKYPLTVSYYGILKAGDLERTPGRFLDWLLSEEGKKCVEQAGYVAP